LVDSAFPEHSGVANSDILKIYLGLLCQGKNDFVAIVSCLKQYKTLVFDCGGVILNSNSVNARPLPLNI
jgi:hypothetical protein